MKTVTIAAFVLAIAAAAAGQPTGGARIDQASAGAPAAQMPRVLRDIGFDQKLDQSIPLDLPFRDEHDRPVRLGELFGSKPVVLALVYYDCPMLCTQVLNGLAASLGVLVQNAGREFDVVTVSFDPREKPALAAAKKAVYLRRYQRPTAEQGWHFLTGDQPSIDRLTKAVGFRYVWDESLKQFAHPTGVVVLTPEGRIARYLFGIEYGPRDLRFAIMDASAGKIGTPVDQVLLYCYHYDPEAGRYGFAVMRALRIAGVATVLCLGTFIFLMVRRDRRRGAPGTRAPGTRAPGTRAPGTAPGTRAPGTAPGTQHPARGTS